MKKGYRKKQLKVRIFLIFILVGFMLDVAISGISYVMYTKNMNAEGDRICTGISEAIASTLNGNRVDDWIEGKRLGDYEETKERLLNLMNSYSDIVNIQVYKMNIDGAKVVYDMSRGKTQGNQLGKTIEYNDRLSGVKNELIAGEYISTLFTRNGKETIVTSLTPVTDMSNEVTCYAICEITMNTMQKNRMTFMKSLFVTMLIISFGLIFVLNIYMNHIIVGPLSMLDSKLRKIVADNSNAEEVKEEVKNINCHGLIELANMRDDFITMIDEIGVRNQEVDEFDKTAREKLNKATRE